ncbi:MAG: DUF134 domain-containing protein [Candidatus Hadarchaeales archaeon]
MKPRFIGVLPGSLKFEPMSLNGAPIPRGEPIYLTFDEFEALRLVFYEGLLQEEAARRMGISRGTLWRCLESARRKLASMLVEGRTLIVAPEPER